MTKECYDRSIKIYNDDISAANNSSMISRYAFTHIQTTGTPGKF
jgi:hypothetical protein